MQLVKNFLYNLFYQVLVLIIPLITVPYVSRVMGPEGVGINGYTSSIATYFILFGSIGINLYGNRTIAYVRNDQKKLSQTFWEITLLRVLTMCLSIFAFLGLVLLTRDQTDKMALFLQVISLFAAIIDISWLYMGLEDFKKTVTRNTIVKIVSLLFIFVFVKKPEDIYRYILILTGSTFFGNLTLWMYLKKTLVKVDWKKLNILRHLKPSIHLFIPQVAIQVYLVLNKTMLGNLNSIEAVGYFDNADKLIKVLLAVVTAIGTVMLPRMAYTFATGNLKKMHEYMNHSFDLMSAVAFPMSFGLIGVSPYISKYFFGESFKGIELVVSILCPIIIFIAWSNVIGNQYLVPKNDMKPYTLSVTVGAFVNLVLNFFILKKYGAVGAAVTTLISEMVVTVIQLDAVKDELEIKNLFKNVPKYFLGSTFMLIGILILNYLLPASIWTLGLKVLIGINIYIGCMALLKPTSLFVIKDFIKKRK